jgi:hypothetical protein
MREDSSRWDQIHPSAFPHARDGLRELASHVPAIDSYRDHRARAQALATVHLTTIRGVEEFA